MASHCVSWCVHGVAGLRIRNVHKSWESVRLQAQRARDLEVQVEDVVLMAKS
jgi:hypothetical protein